MTMILRNKKKVYKYDFVEKLEREFGKDYTAKQAVDFMFGDYDGTYQSEYQLYKWSECDKTVSNRINMLWAVPLTLLCSPYHYVIRGGMGWDDKTVVGRFICRVTGHLKD